MSDTFISVPSVQADGTEIWGLINTRYIVAVQPIAEGSPNRSRILLAPNGQMWSDTIYTIVVLKRHIDNARRWDYEDMRRSDG